MLSIAYVLISKYQERYRTEVLGDSWSQKVQIVLVNFNKEHKAMLGHCKMLLEQEPRKIAINPDRFDKLITAIQPQLIMMVR